MSDWFVSEYLYIRKIAKHVIINPFVPNAPFSTPCFQWVEKVCIRSEWVNKTAIWSWFYDWLNVFPVITFFTASTDVAAYPFQANALLLESLWSFDISIGKYWPKMGLSTIQVPKYQLQCSLTITLKRSENFWFSYIFREYERESLA